MTTPGPSPTANNAAPLDPQQLLETELGSQVSAYQPWLGIDVETGDWWDTEAKFEAMDLEAMLALDGHARAVEQVLTLPVRAAPFTVKPAKGDTGEAALVNDVLANMPATPLRQVIGQAAQSVIYRITYMEKIFTVRDDGKIGYSAVAWRPPDSCGLLRDRGTGAITGFKQSLYGKASPVTIPLPKAAVFLHGANRDPVRGTTEMAVSFRCFKDKQKLRALWMLFLERAGAPWVIAQTEAGQEASVSNTLSQLRGGGVAALSQLKTGTAPTTLDVIGEAGQVFQSAIQYLDSEMAISVLAGFLDLASSASRGAGSLALSQDQTDFYADAMDAIAREIAETFAQQISLPIVRFNFGPTGVLPIHTLGPIGGATLEQMLTLVQSLSAVPPGSGIFPQEFVDELLINLAGGLDLDVDKISAAIQTRAAQLPQTPATVPSNNLHATVSAISDAVRAQTA